MNWNHFLIVSGAIILVRLCIAAYKVFPKEWTNARLKAIQVGGLYGEEGKDGLFRVCKVLALDRHAVHVRIYKNKFTALPNTTDMQQLSLGAIGDSDGFGIGHVPIQRTGWLDRHTFLKLESVSEDELEGYRIYLEAMND